MSGPSGISIPVRLFFQSDSLFFYGTHRDTAIHHVDDVFGNGQAETGAAVQSGGVGGFLGKGLEDVRISAGGAVAAVRERL